MTVELLRTLGALLESPGSEPTELQRLADVLQLGPVPSAAEHNDLFHFQLYPYASVYLGKEGMLGGEARDRIAGFWRILDLEPPSECDHLTAMLTYLSEVATRENEAPERQKERWSHLRQTFLREQLLSWMAPWLHRLQEVAPPFYQDWGKLLEDTLKPSNNGAIDDVPAFLRQTPSLADPRHEGLDGFLDALFAPCRSGLILLRDDLRRAAKHLGLGVRLAERKYVLKGLLMQNAADTLDWLAREAFAWSARHQELSLASPAVTAYWSDRAASSGRLLQELAEERRALADSSSSASRS